MTTRKIETCLNKVIRSHAFSCSLKSRQVLCYILQCICSNKEQDLCESAIAVDVLGKDKSFNPYYDSSVRVVFYRLKQRLAEYYSGEGKDDAYPLVFEKGQYLPFFQKKRACDDYQLQDVHKQHHLRSLFLSFEKTLDPVFLKMILEYAPADLLATGDMDGFYPAIRALSLYLLNYLFQESPASALAEADLLCQLAQSEHPRQPLTTIACFFRHYFNCEYHQAFLFANRLVTSPHPEIRGLGLWGRYLCTADSVDILSLRQTLHEYPYYSPFIRIPFILDALSREQWTEAQTEFRLFSLIPNEISGLLGHLLYRFSAFEESFSIYKNPPVSLNPEALSYIAPHLPDLRSFNRGW